MASLADLRTEREAPARRSKVAIPHARRHFYGVLARACRPRPITTVSQWADKNRVLTSEGSSEPGQWSTERTPYLREIMDCLSVSSPVERVVMMFASQIGKTEVGLNWIGYVMDHAPAAMLGVVPTLEVRKKWVLQRLAPMLRETPALRALFSTKRRDATNSEDIKTFPGGMLVLAGANSPSSLASMPIRFVLCDEVDSYDAEFAEEGDAMGVITQRTVTFPRRKILLISTPKKDRGDSVIEAEYEKSDMREYHVPCPHCDEYQVLRWRHPDGSYGLKRNEATGNVHYYCRHCGERIEEHYKPRMLARGMWIARHPERKTRGYHLSALYSPIGLGLSWSVLMDEWMEAQGDTGRLKAFVQLKLGETWESKKEGVNPLSVIAGMEEYPAVMPRRLRAVGIDVQKSPPRVEMTVYDFGPGEECWGIEHVVCEGDPFGDEVWDELQDRILDFSPDCGAIDTGFASDQCYAFIARKGMRFLVDTKGIKGEGKTLIEDPKTRKNRLRTKRKKGRSPHLISNEAAMGLIVMSLRLRPRDDGAPVPGLIHFPKGEQTFDEEFFRQLTAPGYVEKKVKRGQKRRIQFEWYEHANHPRNEAFDCWKLALAAVRLSGRSLEAVKSPPEQGPGKHAEPASVNGRRARFYIAR